MFYCNAVMFKKVFGETILIYDIGVIAKMS